MVKAIIISGSVSILFIYLGLVVFFWISDKPVATAAIHMEGSSLVLHRGIGYNSGSKLVVTNADKQRRVRIISEQVSFLAEDMPFMVWKFTNMSPQEGMWVGWVAKKNPGKLNMIPVILPLDSTVVYRMKGKEGWSGEIVALGFGFDGQMYDSLILDSIELKTYSVTSMLESIWDEWLAFRPWTQRSISEVQIGAEAEYIKPPLLIFIWIVFTFGLLFKINTKYFNTKSLLYICFSAWFFIDLQWQLNLMRQHKLSQSLYNGKTLVEKIESGKDAGLFDLMRYSLNCKRSKKAEIEIASSYTDHGEYQPLRFQYLLLPEIVDSSYVIRKKRKMCYVILKTTSTKYDKNGNLYDPNIINFKYLMDYSQVYYKNNDGIIYFIDNGNIS